MLAMSNVSIFQPDAPKVYLSGKKKENNNAREDHDIRHPGYVRSSASDNSEKTRL